SSNPTDKIHPRAANRRNAAEGGKRMTVRDTFFRLDGRVALVTGGGQGIGAAICTRLAAAGARVAVFDRSAEAAEQTARAVAGLAVPGDVTAEEDVAGALRRVTEAFGRLDILVNNAGVTGRAGRCWELSRADLEDVLAVNVVGPFLCCRAALPGMIERRFGRVVNVASIAGK